MAMAEILLIVMCATTLGVLLIGYPVAFSLAGTALLFAFVGSAIGVLDWTLLGALPQRIFVLMTTEVLVAAPLFIFMGVMLQRSRVAEDLLESIGILFGPLRGGLGIGVVVVGALLAASTGVVGATVVTMGLLSLPVLMRHGYSASLASGTICAAGTLGQIIPPSIILIFLGDFLGYANQEAQYNLGKFTGGSVSVVDLFAGALLPGLVLVGGYVLYLLALGIFRPSSVPAVDRVLLQSRTDQSIVKHAIGALVAPIGLIVSVLGSILAGVATPTEGAAVGAVGSILLADHRIGGRTWKFRHIAVALAVVVLLVLSRTADLRLGRTGMTALDFVWLIVASIAAIVLLLGILTAIWRIQRAGVLYDVARSTAETTTMVFTILIGATTFTLVFRDFGGDDIIRGWLSSLPAGAAGAMIVVMAVMFVLGFFLDVLEIMFVVIPVVVPTLLAMGLDPLWLGIMMAINLQTSFLTPPFGFALFYLRGVAPAEVRTTDIYRGAIPFVLIQIAMLGVLALFPDLATWLPKLLFGK